MYKLTKQLRRAFDKVSERIAMTDPKILYAGSAAAGFFTYIIATNSLDDLSSYLFKGPELVEATNYEQVSNVVDQVSHSSLSDNVQTVQSYHIGTTGESDISSRIECPGDVKGHYKIWLEKKIFNPSDITRIMVDTDHLDIISGGIHRAADGYSHGSIVSTFQVTVDDKCGHVIFEANRWGNPAENGMFKYGKHILYIMTNKFNYMHEIKILFLPPK